MNSEFFYEGNIYGGVYYSNYTLPEKNLYSSKYIVTNYLSSNQTPEKIMDDYYIYNMKSQVFK